MIENLLFDFDGTIVDTSEGIIKSMHYAFEKLGIKTLPDLRIKQVIGPPLQEMFKILLNSTDKEIINKGIFYFREIYSKNGLSQLKLYDNVQETLSYLYTRNINLFIVTSKPYEFTKTIIENLEIKKYFKDISGTSLNKEVKSKGDRVGGIIKKYKLEIEKTVMIGDRKEDILAARQNKLKTIGMLYGFGKKEELKSVDCSYLCSEFEDLKSILCKIDQSNS